VSSFTKSSESDAEDGSSVMLLMLRVEKFFGELAIRLGWIYRG
jgi:hypothetical protein